jgi:DNA polymerase-4
MTTRCRDCFRTIADAAARRCPACHSPRVLSHPELDRLLIAHIDCDAFYAAVEKRDDPSLRNQPVIIGGGRRGVVSTACYLARVSGVRSAMPMFKARRLCPDAVIIRPNMAKYSEVSKEIRHLMTTLTPLVEPLSIDEAFLDLTGTERLHKARPVTLLTRLAATVERDIGITLSVGLSYNKFLAKLASDLDKPRGFTVIGRAEAIDFLSRRPIGDIWGVGKRLNQRLNRDGVRRIGDLRHFEDNELMARYGAIGGRLAHFARGEDDRSVHPSRAAKSLSAETTFNDDLTRFDALTRQLWPLCEKVSRRLKRNELAGRVVTLKLKTAGFQIRTRRHSMAAPTQLADVLYAEGSVLLRKEVDGTPFRLIGIGASGLGSDLDADPPDFLEPAKDRAKQVELTMDKVRARFGNAAITKGRALTSSEPSTVSSNRETEESSTS